MLIPVLVIAGQTAVGKTDLSIELAEKYQAEIISADSRQVYKYLDIGTAKPSKAILKRLNHHFINHISPDIKYTAGDFAQEARQKINELRSIQKNVIVAGGSGLYIKALLEGIINDIKVDHEIQNSLYRRLKDEGVYELYNDLKRIDPDLAKRISSNDKQRILRGLEVYYSAGIRLSEMQKADEEPAAFPYIKIGLNMKREALYSRINARADMMMNDGLVEEVKTLINLGYENTNALNTVGYKEIIRFLKNEIDYDSCITLIKQNTRRYAKRQMTWFRKDTSINWFNLPDTDIIEKISSLIREKNKQ